MDHVRCGGLMFASRPIQSPRNRSLTFPEAKRSRTVCRCISDRLNRKLGHAPGPGSKFVCRLTQEVYGYDPIKAFFLNEAVSQGDVDGSSIETAVTELQNDPDFAEICSVLSTHDVYKLIAKQHPELLLNEGLEHIEGFEWLPKCPEDIPEFQSADCIVNKVFRIRSVFSALRGAKIAPRKLMDVAKTIRVFSGGLIDDISVFSNSQLVWIAQNEGRFFNGMARLRSTLPPDVYLTAYLIEFWEVVELEDEGSIDRLLHWITLLDGLKSYLSRGWAGYQDVLALDHAFGLAERMDDVDRPQFDEIFHLLASSAPGATTISLQDPEILYQMVQTVFKRGCQASVWLDDRSGFESPQYILLGDGGLDNVSNGIETITSILSRLVDQLGGNMHHIIRDQPGWVLQSENVAESLKWSSEMLLVLCQTAGIGKLSAVSNTKELVGALKRATELRGMLVDEANMDETTIQEHISLLGYCLNHLAAPTKPGIEVLRFVRLTDARVLAEFVLHPKLIESQGAQVIELFDHDMHYTLDHLVRWPELVLSRTTLSMAIALGRAAGGNSTCKRCDMDALRVWFNVVDALREQGVPGAVVVKMLGQLRMSTGCNLMRSRGFAVFDETYKDRLVALLLLWWQSPERYETCQKALTTVAKSKFGKDIHVEQLFTLLLYHYNVSVCLDLSDDIISGLTFAGWSSPDLQQNFPLICFTALLFLQTTRPSDFGSDFGFDKVRSVQMGTSVHLVRG
ncbi:hypothetical protein BSKO_02346 [Bryopsis sp. KO-2023]|nr:hypothetical protein BSKO_02346 [Bryopsis sp. KO-2023]